MAASTLTIKDLHVEIEGSTSISSTSLPSSVMLPFVTSYLGCPIIAADKVDLPVPFGPITAWNSPPFISRFTPFKISFPSIST